MLTVESEERLRAMVTRHEGCRSHPYRDQGGILTIGVGRNLSDVGLNQAEIALLLSNDLAEAWDALSFYPWFAGLNEARQAALVDMVLNLGAPRFLLFQRLHAALAEARWFDAGHEMRTSRWARQVGGRAAELAGMIEQGEWPSCA